MPALSSTIIDDLLVRLTRHLAGRPGYGEPIYLNAGGSAAVFKVPLTDGSRVFKVFNPTFFNTPNNEAEKRRLGIQSRLIGHTCPSLVQTLAVVEAEETAIIEMEYIDWPQLVSVLDKVPDEAIVPLFSQLVEAVKFLDSQGIVHRDIKPENIHVSPDFKLLKLLDLGVAREVEHADEQDIGATDHGQTRPFLATAQYSSPEYLFRLDEPSAKLWKGLNFYQLGAVLHDLINKEAIFQHEMGLGNRWLVARAVLAKTPVFNDANPSRLTNLKSLSLRCLEKDLDSRLQFVSWEDFILEGTSDPLVTLRARLAKGQVNAGNQTVDAKISRLKFDRQEFFRRFCDMVRTELIHVCGTNLPLTLHPSEPNAPQAADIAFAANSAWSIECKLTFDWQGQLFENTAHLVISSRLSNNQQVPPAVNPSSKRIATVTISENEQETALFVAGEIAKAATFALDLLEGGGDVAAHHGIDLLTN